MHLEPFFVTGYLWLTLTDNALHKVYYLRRSFCRLIAVDIKVENAFDNLLLLFYVLLAFREMSPKGLRNYH